jgi:vang-like
MTETLLFQNERELTEVQGWALICDTLLSRPIRAGTLFQLRQGEVSLLVTVHNLPHLHLTEEIIDPKSNKFVLRMSSETSV